MEYRELGRSGIGVSGFGAWAIGGDARGPVEDAESLAAMGRALELGVDFVDTADVYGDGRSESLVAGAIEGRRDEVVPSTKGGLMGHHRGLDAVQLDYSILNRGPERGSCHTWRNTASGRSCAGHSGWAS